MQVRLDMCFFLAVTTLVEMGLSVLAWGMFILASDAMMK